MNKRNIKKTPAFVINSFQTPNGYVDDVMSYLTGEEFKVLIYATRRILGFQKRQDRISISQFTDGTQSKDGEDLDYGTGLSIETVKKCLARLVEFGLMVRLAENDAKTNEGTLWSLQWDTDKVNWASLEKREEKKSKTFSKKMKKARSMRHTPPNGIERTPPNGIETQNTGKHRETQGRELSQEQLSFLKKAGLEWLLSKGSSLEEIEQAIEEAKRRELVKPFEQALGFSKPLPWWDGKEWTEFAEWVVARQQESPKCFGEYNVWRNTKYTKGGMTNNRIRGFVTEFYDSWDSFMMSKQPVQDSSPRPEHQPYQPKEEGNYVKAPNLAEVKARLAEKIQQSLARNGGLGEPRTT